MIDFRGSRLMTLSACALAVAATTMTAMADQPDATAANEKIVRQAFETWVEGTYVFNELLAPDVVWTIHGSGPVAGTYTNMDDFVERAATPITSRLASPLVPEVHDIWVQDDTVIVRFDGSATTNSGAPYNNQFVWIFRMEKGLVAEAEAFLDLVAYQEVVDNNEPRAD